MKIALTDVVIPDDRARALGDFSALADSIREVGLLQPIVVGRDMVLVAGLHRLRACESLGWKEIEATVCDLEGLRAELAEIDENLCRSELTVLQRGEHLAKRKRIYEFLHPETKAKVAGGKARQGVATEIISFAADTAKKTGMSERSVRHDVQIAERLAPEVKEAIRGTEVEDSKTDLLALARIKDGAQQKAAAEERVREKAAPRRRPRYEPPPRPGMSPEFADPNRVASLVAQALAPIIGLIDRWPDDLSLRPLINAIAGQASKLEVMESEKGKRRREDDAA